MFGNACMAAPCRTPGRVGTSGSRRLAVHKQREPVSCWSRAPAAQDLAAPDLAGFAGPGSTGNSAAHAPDSGQQHRETVSPPQSETRGHIGGAAAPRQSRNLPTPCQCGAAAVGGAVPQRRNCATSHTSPAGSGLPVRLRERVAGLLIVPCCQSSTTAVVPGHGQPSPARKSAAPQAAGVRRRGLRRSALTPIGGEHRPLRRPCGRAAFCEVPGRTRPS